MYSTYEQIEKHKQAALKLLAPFGFVDNEDDESPGTIWHPETKECYDISATDPAKIVMLVYQRGIEVGEFSIKRKLRELAML